MTFEDKMQERMRYCLSVTGLRDILNEMIEDGYSDAQVAMRIGHTDDCRAVCFPLADIRVDPDKSKVLFTPSARVKPCGDTLIPEFDIHIDVNDDDIRLSFEEVIFQTSQED